LSIPNPPKATVIFSETECLSVTYYNLHFALFNAS